MAKNTHIIEVKTTGAEKSKKQLQGVSGSLKNMAKQAGVAAAAYFGSQALLSAISSSIDLFGQQEEAEKKLRFAAGDATNELIKQAEAIQKNSRFGDEAVIAQQAYVKSLGVSTEQTKEIIQASVDLASALNISLESAVMNTTKTLSGMQGELGEKLPAAFKELTPEALKAGEGIKFIAEQFAGTAQADAETFSGRIDQMSNAVGDAGEALGEVLAPAVIAAANVVKGLAEAFSGLIGFQDELIKQYSQQFRLLTESESAMRDFQETVNQMDMQDVIQGFRDQGIFLNELTDAQVKATISSEAFQEVLQAGLENGTEQGEMLQMLFDRYQQLDTVLNKSKIGYESYAKAQLDKLKKDKQEEENQKKFIKMYPEQAKALGLLTDTKKAESRTSASQVINNHKSEAESGLVAQIMSSLPFPINLVAARGASKLVDELFNKITFAQYGADFVTSGPQMMMVGEGSGPERVQVTPLVDPNIDGPQSQGITLNITGNVLHESFVEDNVIPQIREGLRLGENIGI
tara:strand:- start:707 stop:2263 length:1557 start_codon:yes stop_codon:yes gene_type:complete